MTDLFFTISTRDGLMHEIVLRPVGGAAAQMYHIMHWQGDGWYYAGSLWHTAYGWRMDGKFLGWMDVIVGMVK